MSAAIPKPLETILVVDPMCDFEAKGVYAVEKSVSTSNYYTLTSNNSSSVSTTWVINVNDNTTITDRLFLADVTWQINIPADGNGFLPANTRLALRSFPQMKMANNYVLTLGNAVCTVQIGDIANCLERYGLMNKYLNYSSTPVQCDMLGSYAQLAGSNIDPFATYNTTQSEIANPRGGFYINSIVQAPNMLTLQVRIVEPIFISPLLQSMGMDGRKEGMTKLSQIQLQVNWNGNLWQRLLSSVGALNTIGVPTITPIANGSILRVVQYVPSVLDIGRNLDTQCLAYNEVVSFASGTAQLTGFNPATGAPGATELFVSQVIQLSRIPKEMFFFVRPDNTIYNDPTRGSQCPDTFGYYQSATMQVNFNGTNQLINISDINLYRICRQNGCNLPWSAWGGGAMTSLDLTQAAAAGVSYTYGVGSPICLKFGRDIMLPPDLAPGTNTKCNLQIQAAFGSTIPNVAPFNAPVAHTAYVVIVYEGCLEIYGSGGTAAQTLGCLSTEDVLQAVKRNMRVHYEVINDDFVGGANIFSRAFNWLREGKYRPYVEKVRSFIEHPIIQDVAKHASHHLRSKGHEGAANAISKATEKGLIDSVLHKIEGHGGGLVGGKRISKKKLKEMLL